MYISVLVTLLMLVLLIFASEMAHVTHMHTYEMHVLGCYLDHLSVADVDVICCDM